MSVLVFVIVKSIKVFLPGSTSIMSILWTVNVPTWFCVIVRVPVKFGINGSDGVNVKFVGNVFFW